MVRLELEWQIQRTLYVQSRYDMLTFVRGQHFYALHIIQLEVSEPATTTPDRGNLAVSVDISPSCAIYSDDRGIQAHGTDIADRIEK